MLNNFITALTLQAVSGHQVRDTLLDAEAESGMDHIDLARWADKIIIAPASADFIAKLAHGLADDLLSTLCLATQASVYVAPAMNHQMWQNPATQTQHRNHSKARHPNSRAGFRRSSLRWGRTGKNAGTKCHH